VHGALGPVARAQARAADAVALTHELAHGEAIEHGRPRLCRGVVQDRVEGDAAHDSIAGRRGAGTGMGTSASRTSPAVAKRTRPRVTVARPWPGRARARPAAAATR